MYPFTECEYSASTPFNLKQHIASKHDEIKYPCDKCKYAAMSTGNLKQHRERNHWRYCVSMWRMWSYINKRLNLKNHKEIKHPCEYCAYSATKKSELSKHKKRNITWLDMSPDIGYEKVIVVVIEVIWGQIFGHGEVKWPPIGLKHWKVEYWSHYLSFDMSYDMGYEKVIVVVMDPIPIIRYLSRIFLWKVDKTEDLETI